MEQFMHYIWQHRLWPAADMTTVDGQRVVVIDPGRHNTDAGSDFFNAKLSIGNQMWAGDVEIHVRASDWFRHGHQCDKAYDSVVLHVVDYDDAQVARSDGRVIPQLCLRGASTMRGHYQPLTSQALRPELPCGEVLSSMPAIHVNSWLDSLAYERLYEKSERIVGYLARFDGDWEQACFITLARALGFSTNSLPFERLAMSVPLRVLAKHSDSPLAVEAVLFGQAGLLDNVDAVGGADPYAAQLRQEYAYQAHLFGLPRPERLGWKMARMRPANFPHRRIALLARMAMGGFRMMGHIAAVRSIADVEKLFDHTLDGYWSRHYTFGAPLPSPQATALSRDTINVLTINVVVPLLHAYATSRGDMTMTETAMALLQSLPPERNSIVAHFVTHGGISCKDAFTSQALIQLRRAYCETAKCLYCRIGHRMMAARIGVGAQV